MVAFLGEPDQTVEDCLGPLDGRLGTAQDDLVSAHDDLALDELLDPPQDGVSLAENLQGLARRYDKLDFYLAARCGVRRYSFLRFEVQVSAIGFSPDSVAVDG